ncbi:hypothetical protein B0H21DRAFT_840251 [Amylocystis lapponica]|nr:hypothetical protein B0H21DRAFT_840251 [Amylocystis lapponica]
MTLNFDVFGAVTGALGLFGLVPIIYTVVQSQLPSRWQKSLDEILGETETIWREALEEAIQGDVDHSRGAEETPPGRSLYISQPASSGTFYRDLAGTVTDAAASVTNFCYFFRIRRGHKPRKHFEQRHTKTSLEQSSKPEHYASAAGNV